MTVIGSSTPSFPSRSSSPSQVLLANDRQAVLEDDASPSRPYSPSLISSHALSNEENRWQAVVEERDSEIARLQRENLRLLLERQGGVTAEFSVMEISSNLGNSARRIDAQRRNLQALPQRMPQDNVQEPAASSSTSLLSEPRLSANYQTTNSSNHQTQEESNSLAAHQGPPNAQIQRESGSSYASAINQSRRADMFLEKIKECERYMNINAAISMGSLVGFILYNSICGINTFKDTKVCETDGRWDDKNHLITPLALYIDMAFIFGFVVCGTLVMGFAQAGYNTRQAAIAAGLEQFNFI